MSYTTIFLIRSNDTLETIAKLENSYGFGPFVWSVLCKRYLGDEMAWSAEKGAEKLWALGYEEKVPKAWRAALLCTYDFAIIERTRFHEIAGLLKDFVNDPRVLTGSHVCHVDYAIPELLEKHADDTDVYGMCFQATSTVDDLWFEYDGEEDESKPYDLKTGTKHFFVGETLDKTERKE